MPSAILSRAKDRIRSLRGVDTVVRNARAVRGHGPRYLWQRFWVGQRAAALGPFPFSGAGEEVHVLSCARDATDLEWALVSLHTAGGSDCRVIVHDDGSLDRRHVSRLEGLFPGVRVIGKPEGDALTGAYLRGHPASIAYRQHQVWAMKLFDFAATAESSEYWLLDSDVLFFGSFLSIRRQAEHPARRGRSVFMRDYQRAYSIGPDDFARVLGSPMEMKINTGLARVQRSQIQVERVETLLRTLPVTGAGLSWAEQTLYALLSGVDGTALFDDDVVVGQGRGLEGVAVKHYVGPIRALMYMEGVPDIVWRVREGHGAATAGSK